jgi:uncharacterized protein (TIGR03435 family)
MTRTTIGAGVMAFMSCIALGQPAAHPPTFEVASVKVADGSGTTVASNGGIMVQRRAGGDPGMIDYKNVTLKFLLARAYGMKEDRILGPDWLGSESYDIMAKKPAAVPQDQTMLMLQALLSERFKLTLHKETRTMPVYALTMAKGGPKLKEIDPAVVAAFTADAARDGSQPPPATPGGGGGTPPPVPIGGLNVNMNGQSTQLKGRVPMSEFVNELGHLVDRPVVDLTELKGAYDIDIAWVPEGSDAGAGRATAVAITSSGDGGRTVSEREVDLPTGTIFQVLKERLGLRLEARRLPLEMIVVDHAEKVPTAN